MTDGEYSKNEYIEVEYKEVPPEVSVEESKPLYSTGDVGRMMGISHDMVRIYTKEFSDYISVKTVSDNKRSHARYTKEEAELLIKLVRMKKEGLPRSEIDRIMKSPAAQLTYEMGGKSKDALEIIMTKNNRMLIAELIDIINKNNSEQKELLKEELDEYVAMAAEKLKSDSEDKISMLEEEIRMLTEEIRELRSNRKGFFARHFGKKE